MRSVATITWLTFHEAWRRWMVVVALLLGLLFVLLYWLGINFILDELRKDVGPMVDTTFVKRQAGGLLLQAGLYVVHFLSVMLAIFTAIDSVSGEIASHTIQAVVTKPIHRWAVVLGKWLGYGAMLTVYIVLLAGGILLTVRQVFDYEPPNILPALGLFVLAALALLSLALFLSTRFSTLTNGVVLFMLYGIAFLGSWVEQFATVLKADTAARIGQSVGWVLPVEVLWRRTAEVLEPAGMRDELSSPFSSLSPTPEALVPYTLVYVLVALGLAMWSFSRRDL